MLTTTLPTIIYPGHPIVIALHIMKAFKSAKAALLNAEDPVCGRDQFPCLSSSLVPGGGNAVFEAAKMLKDMWTGYLSIHGVRHQAGMAWNSLNGAGPGSGHEANFERGKEQADECWDAFNEAVGMWDWGWEPKPEYKSIEYRSGVAFEVEDQTTDLSLQCRYLGIILQDSRSGKWATSWNALFDCNGLNIHKFRFNTREDAVADLVLWHGPGRVRRI